MKKLGLALGGGGARGAAHIGVLMELERLGIRPQQITGTSIGGLVGALLAAGVSTEEMEEFFQELSLGNVYSLPGGTPALAGNHKIEKLLEKTLGRIEFSDLQIPLSVVTVDLVSRKEVVLDEGDLISALLATIAMPVLLPPVQRGSLTLVDGGILNNVPFDVVRARGATYVIAVDLTNTSPYSEAPHVNQSTPGVVARVLNVTQRRPVFQVLSTAADIITEHSFNSRLAVSQPELLLRPRLGTIGLFDFHRWPDGVKAGKDAAVEAANQLNDLAGKLG